MLVREVESPERTEALVRAEHFELAIRRRERALTFALLFTVGAGGSVVGIVLAAIMGVL